MAWRDVTKGVYAMFLFKKKSLVNCSIEDLKEAAEYLRQNPEIEVNPYPVYGKEIMTVLDSLGMDTNYLQKHEKIEDKDIGSMSWDDLRVMFTLITRSERFCDGSIAGYVADGTLLKLLERELALLEKDIRR